MSTARNTYETLSPLTWLLKILAINCNLERESYSQIYYLTKTLLTMGVIGSLNVFCLYYKVNYIFATISSSIKLTDTLQMVYDHLQYIVDLWFVYKYGRHISIEYFKQYESIDLILGVIDYNSVKWKLTKLICFFSTVWLTSSAFDVAAWYLGYGWLSPLIYSIAYFYLFTKIITTLDLTSHIMNIEIRLTMMADLVQNFYVTSENLPGCVGDSICNENWLHSKSYSRALKLKSSVNPLKVSSKNDGDEVQLLKKCYLLLTDQVEFINCMFGFRILLNSLSLLIDIIRFMNLSVRLIIGTQKTTYDAGYLPAVSSVLRMLTCITVLISLVVHCKKTYDQKDRIVSIIDHLIVNKNPSEKLRTAMIELRALVLARPVSFNTAGFFRLDYSFLVSIASVMYYIYSKFHPNRFSSYNVIEPQTSKHLKIETHKHSDL